MIKIPDKVQIILKSQLGLSVIFGSLSLFLGMIKFEIPGMDGGLSDMREIPLLISIIYIQNPIYFLLESAITSLISPPEASRITIFAMHGVALIVGRHIYIRHIFKDRSSLELGISWLVMTTILYCIFLVPILMLSDHLLGVNLYPNAIRSYLEILSTLRFELLTTGLITGLYLIQMKIRLSLEEHQQELEDRVDKRTSQLALANHNLMSVNKSLLNSNHEKKALNDNLDEMVKKRTERVREQLDQLIKYAHMNSHEVRAPLSRILGLIPVISAEKNPDIQREMMEALEKSSTELEQIIKSMNMMLKSEVGESPALD
jgi:signal transduction histidine kinase